MKTEADDVRMLWKSPQTGDALPPVRHVFSEFRFVQSNAMRIDATAG